MNAYSTTGQSRIQQRDITDVLLAHRFMAPVHLAALERHRSWQAVAEHERLLKEHSPESTSNGSPVAMLRQSLGATLVRVGERLARVSPSAAASEAASRVGSAS